MSLKLVYGSRGMQGPYEIHKGRLKRAKHNVRDGSTNILFRIDTIFSPFYAHGGK